MFRSLSPLPLLLGLAWLGLFVAPFVGECARAEEPERKILIADPYIELHSGPGRQVSYACCLSGWISARSISTIRLPPRRIDVSVALVVAALTRTCLAGSIRCPLRWRVREGRRTGT